MKHHIGDDAELYAVGALDEVAAAAVERHVLDCRACSLQLAQAREGALALAGALPPVSAQDDLLQRIQASVAATPQIDLSRWLTARVTKYAVAAALVFSLFEAGWQASRYHRQMAAQDVALATLVHSHFEHVSMTSLTSPALAAKVLYARDGSWIYIIADRPGGDLRVLGYTAGAPTRLGVLRGDGRTASLLLHPSKHIHRVVLEHGDAPVAEATLK
ncbi:MAG TPA: hypothetical protein VGF18_05200 [Candidatus Tumulicola sp.]